MRLQFIFVVVVLTISCESSAPDNILSRNKMQTVLWDMMQADEMAAYYSMTDTSFLRLEKHVDYYQKVLAVHKIDKKDFVKSLRYYENNPSKLKTILDSLQKFGERQQKADSAAKQVPVIDDTLKKPSMPSRRRL